MKLAIIGTGYVGTVAGACFAESGNDVICVDKDPEKVRALADGDPLIYEPGLELLLKRNILRKRIRFTTKVTEAAADSQVIFMTVGTPSLQNGEADLSYLEQAVRETARAMTGRRVIVNKSTVPVGTHRKVAQWLREESPHEFAVVSNPEFLREGCAVQDFLEPERVVIGTSDAQAFNTMRSLYLPFVERPEQILCFDNLSAELTKYACNAFLATRISFINEMARLCEELGAEIESIRMGMATDSRIGPHFFHAGLGYGGSCFPKDIRALLRTGASVHTPLRIVAASEEVNEEQKIHLLKSITGHFGEDLSGRTFALWGLAFKPNTDDIREAPALALARRLLDSGAKLRVYDPAAMRNVQTIFGSSFTYCSDAYDAARGADALIVATEWDAFSNPDLQRLQSLLKAPVIFDGRNVFSPPETVSAGFRYVGIGRGAAARAMQARVAEKKRRKPEARVQAAG